jgi:hypothetical protein
MKLLAKLLPLKVRKIVKFFNHFFLGQLLIYYNKNRIKKNALRTVYFVVSQPNLTSRSALFAFFREDQRYRLAFLVLPNQELPEGEYLSSLNSNLEFFSKYGCEVIPCWNPEEGFLSTKIVTEYGFVFLEQLSLDITPEISLPALARKCLLIYVPYGVMLSMPSLNHYSGSKCFFVWRVFLESTWHKENLKFVQGKRFEVSGTFSASSIPAIDYSPRREVLWAPHWSVGDSEYNYSTFVDYAMDFLEFVRDNRHIQFAIRPHQRLGIELANTGIMSERDYNSYLEQWAAEPNCRLSLNVTFEGDFDRSLCMITDSVSFLFDYSFTSKPLLRLERESGGFNSLGQTICSYHASAKTFHDVAHFITCINAGLDEGLAQRLSLLKWLKEITPANHVEIISNSIQRI